MTGDRPCAILLQLRPKGEWEFISYTLREEVAWRSAELYLLDEKAAGHLRARVAVVLREDYDAGRIKPLRPPKGFAVKSVSSAVSAEPAVTQPEPEAARPRDALDI
jgi:hypothetical protein